MEVANKIVHFAWPGDLSSCLGCKTLTHQWPTEPRLLSKCSMKVSTRIHSWYAWFKTSNEPQRGIFFFQWSKPTSQNHVLQKNGKSDRTGLERVRKMSYSSTLIPRTAPFTILHQSLTGYFLWPNSVPNPELLKFHVQTHAFKHHSKQNKLWKELAATKWSFQLLFMQLYDKLHRLAAHFCQPGCK